MANLDRLRRARALDIADTTGRSLLPTANNPVISTRPSSPFQPAPKTPAQTPGDFNFVPEEGRAFQTVTTQEKARALPTLPQAGTTLSRPSGANDIFDPTQQKAFGELAREFDTFGESRSEFEAGTRVEDVRAEQARNRAFFNNLRESGISQDQLMELTGATNALDAAAIAQGRGGLSLSEQALVDENIAIARGAIDTAKAEERLLTDEEQIRKDVESRFAPDFTKAREGGIRARETALRVQGRAAQGTKSGIQQQEINDRQQEIEQSISAQQRLEERKQLAIARGASEEELDGIQKRISAAKNTRIAAEDELALRQAGLDEEALSRSADNNKFMLDALKAGFDFDPETQTFSERQGGADKALQFVAPKFDDFGNMLTPAYTFDKKTGKLNLINTQTGLQQEFEPETFNQFNAHQTFANFEEYIKGTGSAQVVGGSPYHQGLELDIDGEIGDPIQSFTSGRVVEVTPEEESGGFGNTVIVENEDGVRIRYAHLDGFNVQKGQMIAAGSLIGPMGNTGSVIPGPMGDGSHLHIEARDGDGNLVSLQDIRSEAPRISPNDVNQLRAAAFQAGYVSNDEVMGFINAVKNGVLPPDKQALEMDDRDFSRANVLRDEFDNKAEVKAFKVVQVAADDFKRILDSGVRGPADLALVFKFMKALDPNSVVREAEFENAANSGGKFKFKGMWTRFNGKFDEGQFLTDEVRNDFLKITQATLRSKKKAFDQELDRFNALADKSGVDRDFVIFDYSNGIEDILSSPRAATEGSPASEFATLTGSSQAEVGATDSFLDSF